MKTSQTTPSRTSASARRSRPGIEGLEDRQLLSMTQTAFARILGSVPSGGSPQLVPIDIAAGDLTAPSAGGPVFLSVSVEAQTPGFTPTLALQVNIRGARTSIAPVSVSPSGNGLASGIFGIPAEAQLLEATVGGAGGGSGAFQLQVGLAGDMNGDGRITNRDVTLTNLVIQGGNPNTVLTTPSVFDYNRDNRFNSEDLDLVNRNLGASTSLRPIFLRTNPDQSTSTQVAGQTLPGATVRLDANRDGQFEQTVVADNLGAYQFTLGSGFGGQMIALQASDRVGQIARADHQVASPPPGSGSGTGSGSGSSSTDRIAPAIILNTPVSGVLTNGNLTIQGTVRDNSGLPVNLMIQVDQGTGRLATVGANGFFQWTTSLPTNGSADGLHRVRLFATDRAGNIGSSELTFTLDATPPPAPTLSSPSTTFLGVVTVQGSTEANAQVRLVGRSGIVIADAQGRFQIPNVPLGFGDNSLQFVVTDLAGNSVTAFRTIRRVVG